MLNEYSVGFSVTNILESVQNVVIESEGDISIDLRTLTINIMQPLDPPLRLVHALARAHVQLPWQV
jgi:hypothetical protein